MLRPNAVMNYCIELARKYDRAITPSQIAFALDLAKRTPDQQVGPKIRETFLALWHITEEEATAIIEGKRLAAQKKDYLKRLAEELDQKILSGVLKPRQCLKAIEVLRGQQHRKLEI